MKISQEKRLVETEGFDAAPKQFNIKQNARAFEILSSNIYSDKPLAVVREYGCNAYDAHVAAGKQDVPFEVHLPNQYEPYLSIKDYGTGLSHEQVMTLYTTYFESSKADSNDFIGALGLGSKSAFAYTDQFTVTSRYNGEKRIYNAFVGEDGAPAITPMSQQETDEPNGVEIFISVKQQDYNTFADRARQVFSRFPVLPIITGNIISLEQVEYSLTGSNYKLRKDGRGGCYAIQGSVAYPINYNSLTLPGMEKYRTLLVELPLDITFPLGELNVTASREQLNYDKVTQANILETAKAILDDLPRHVEHIISGAKTLYEAKMIWANVTNETAGGKLLRQLVGGQAEWNGQPINHSKVAYDFNDEKPLKESDGSVQVDPVSKKPLTYDEPWASVELYTHHNFWKGWGRPDPDNLGSQNTFEIKQGTRFVVTDVKMRISVFKERMKLTFKDDPYKHIFVIFLKDIARLDEAMQQLGSPPAHLIMKSSALMELPKDNRVAALAAKPEVRKAYKLMTNRTYGGLDEIDVDVTLGGTYLLMYNKEIVKPNTENDTYYSLDSCACMIHRSGLMGDQPVYCFNYSHKNIPLKNPKWKSWYDQLYQKLDPIFANKKLLQDIVDLRVMLGITKGYEVLQGLSLITQEHLDTLKSNSPFLKFYKEFNTKVEGVLKVLGGIDPALTTKHLTAGERSKELIEGLKILKNVLPKYTAPDIAGDDIGALALFESQAEAAYPLLGKLMQNLAVHDAARNRFQIAEIIGYIQLCDSRKKGN